MVGLQVGDATIEEVDLNAGVGDWHAVLANYEARDGSAGSHA